MEELFKPLSLQWWITSVLIAGLGMSVLGVYICRLIDKTLSIFSLSWKIRVANKLICKQKHIIALRDDSTLLLLHSFREARSRMESLQYLAFAYFALFCFSLLKSDDSIIVKFFEVFLISATLILITLTIRSIREAWRLEEEIFGATESYKELTASNEDW